MTPTTLLLALAVFLGGYLLNLTWISVFYHRALCHGALSLSPRVTRWVVSAGPWVVGIDPKAWVCMHRLHHTHSDTDLDPHSPRSAGLLGVAVAQLRSYQRVLTRLIAGQGRTSEIVSDLNFDVHPMYRRKLWLAPYAVHGALAFSLGWLTAWPIGLALLAGLSSHPVQGWMVNALAHRYGGMRYENGDDSRNNLVVAFLCFGEGLQNNHHHAPEDPRFSRAAWEIDLGWFMCRALAAAGVVTLNHGPRRD